MLALYLGDSFFKNSPFEKSMRYKLKAFLLHHPCSCVLVSAKPDRIEAVRTFFQDFAALHVCINSAFDSNLLSCDANCLYAGTEEIRPYSGTLVQIDPDSLQYERIYLDLFPWEEYEEAVRQPVETLYTGLHFNHDD